MDSPPTPPHSLGALTSYELSRYRHQLEHALKALPGNNPARAGFQQQLTEVMNEQDSRLTIISTNGQA
jgi:hypothetical protein